MNKKEERQPLSFEYEKTLLEAGKIVCGTDEAGRGPLAGPVCAAAVILPDGLVIEGLDDSKKLTEKKRDALYDEIIKMPEEKKLSLKEFLKK